MGSMVAVSSWPVAWDFPIGLLVVLRTLFLVVCGNYERNLRSRCFLRSSEWHWSKICMPLPAEEQGPRLAIPDINHLA